MLVSFVILSETICVCGHRVWPVASIKSSCQAGCLGIVVDAGKHDGDVTSYLHPCSPNLPRTGCVISLGWSCWSLPLVRHTPKPPHWGKKCSLLFFVLRSLKNPVRWYWVANSRVIYCISGWLICICCCWYLSLYCHWRIARCHLLADLYHQDPTFLTTDQLLQDESWTSRIGEQYNILASWKSFLLE